MAALSALCVVQYRKIQELSAGCVVVEPSARLAAVAGAEIEVQETSEKETCPATAVEKKEGDAISQISPQPLASGSSPVSTNKSPMAGIAEMMKNPGMKDMMRAQMQGQVDLSYDALFKYLQLPDADMQTLKGLLLDKQMARVNLSLEMMTGTATPDARKAVSKRIKDADAGCDAQIKTLLGDDAYAVYQSFEETQPERTQVNLFKKSLSPGDQLTEEQEDRLIRAMYDERTRSAGSTKGRKDDEVPDPSLFTPEQIAKTLKDSAKLQEQYVSAATSILKSGQLAQFKNSQKQQQAMQEMAMNMGAKMFGEASK
jgi:hypothetical protein